MSMSLIDLLVTNEDLVHSNEDECVGLWAIENVERVCDNDELSTVKTELRTKSYMSNKDDAVATDKGVYVYTC